MRRCVREYLAIFRCHRGSDSTSATSYFSKKLSNLQAAITLYVAFYNFCRGHRSHKGATPAMVAGLTGHVWTIAELLTVQ
jgi:hypothetical protein